MVVSLVTPWLLVLLPLVCMLAPSSTSVHTGTSVRTGTQAARVCILARKRHECAYRECAYWRQAASSKPQVSRKSKPQEQASSLKHVLTFNDLSPMDLITSLYSPGQPYAITLRYMALPPSNCAIDVLLSPK